MDEKLQLLKKLLAVATTWVNHGKKGEIYVICGKGRVYNPSGNFCRQ